MAAFPSVPGSQTARAASRSGLTLPARRGRDRPGRRVPDHLRSGQRRPHHARRGGAGRRATAPGGRPRCGRCEPGRGGGRDRGVGGSLAWARRALVGVQEQRVDGKPVVKGSCGSLPEGPCRTFRSRGEGRATRSSACCRETRGRTGGRWRRSDASSTDRVRGPGCRSASCAARR